MSYLLLISLCLYCDNHCHVVRKWAQWPLFYWVCGMHQLTVHFSCIIMKKILTPLWCLHVLIATVHTPLQISERYMYIL